MGRRRSGRRVCGERRLPWGRCEDEGAGVRSLLPPQRLLRAGCWPPEEVSEAPGAAHPGEAGSAAGAVGGARGGQAGWPSRRKGQPEGGVRRRRRKGAGAEEVTPQNQTNRAGRRGVHW